MEGPVDMATRHVATVFGGSGFIGRHVVKRLAHAGYIVRVAVRDPERALLLKPMGAVGQVVPLAAPVTHEGAVNRAVDGANLVVNLVGVLAESRGATFKAIHVDGAERVARIAAAAGVGRLAHLSALGADLASASRYGATKGEAENSLLAAFPRAVILRPSVVFGPDDRFFNRFGEMARLLPFMPVISGTTKMQPVYVCDVADAVMAALTLTGVEGKTFELGGPKVFTFREILALILKETQRHRRLVEVPMGVARMQASVLQHVPGKPLTPDQLVMLSKDNVVAPGAAGLEALGITPTPVELVVPGYLARFRPGGGRRPVTVTASGLTSR
jgi:uncharacterized protein YbjT (DUF2867 family)